MMKTALHYRLLAAALPKEEERIQTSYVPSLVLIVLLSAAIFIALGIRKGATSRTMLPYGLFIIAYTIYLAAWYPRQARRRMLRYWETYDLEIGHNYLLRRQADIPDIRLEFDEVQAVEHVRGKYLRVIGKTASRVISIPESIDNFDQVLETVGSLRRVRVRTIEQWQKQRAFMAVAILLFVTLIWATLPSIVIPLSLAAGSVIAWVIFWIRRNPNVSKSSKRISWIYWLFFAVCVLKLWDALGRIESIKTHVAAGQIAAYIILFCPGALLVFGWMRWWRHRRPSQWRNSAIAWGLAAASVSASCLYGVISYIQLTHIGFAHEHRLAIAGACVGCPLSVFSVIAATVGDGHSRAITSLAGAYLAMVWGIVFFYV